MRFATYSYLFSIIIAVTAVLLIATPFTSIIQYICSPPTTESTSTSSLSHPPCTSHSHSDIAIMGSVWYQHLITLSPKSRGCHLVTHEIMKPIQSDLKRIKIGMCN